MNMHAGGMKRRGERNSRSRLTDKQVRIIRAAAATKQPRGWQRMLARAWEVSEHCVSLIAHGKSRVIDTPIIVEPVAIPEPPEYNAPLPGEEWRPVRGYEGIYEVSSAGRVRRVPASSSFPPLHMLTPNETRNGYEDVTLCNSPAVTPRSVLVHRLVMEAFDGERPTGMTINHKNGNKRDNRHCNLEYATLSENLRHRHRVLGVIPTRGEKVKTSVLTEAAVVRIRSCDLSNARLSREYGVSPSLISMVRTRSIWKHVA